MLVLMTGATHINVYKWRIFSEPDIHREKLPLVISLGLKLKAAACVLRIDELDIPVNTIPRDLINLVWRINNWLASLVWDANDHILQPLFRVYEFILNCDGVVIICACINPDHKSYGKGAAVFRHTGFGGLAPPQNTQSIAICREGTVRVLGLDDLGGSKQALINIWVCLELNAI